MTKDIFISYRRHDSSFVAAKLRDRLEQTFPDHVFQNDHGIWISRLPSPSARLNRLAGFRRRTPHA